MSPRYSLAIALCSLLVIDGTASRAQNLVGLPSASTSRDLAAASHEVDRLTEESSRIDTESSTLGPRRDELRLPLAAGGIAVRDDGATVLLRVESHELDRKLIVFKKKRRKRYQRTQGHRREVTRVRVVEIACDVAAY